MLKNIQLLLIFFSILISDISAQNIELTNSIVVGGVTSTSARFWVRTSAPSQINIELSENSSFSNIILGSAINTTAESSNSGIIEVEGLNPNVQYFYRAVADNLIDNIERSFWTFPEEGTSSTFSFAFGSCQQSGSFLPSSTEEKSVFDEIINHDLRFFLQLGDWGYPDTTDLTPLTNNYFATDYNLVRESYWNKYNKEYPMDNLLKRMPVDYVYDDHDYMNNNSSALTSSFYVPYRPSLFSTDFYKTEVPIPDGARTNSIRGYKEHLPGYPLVNESRGIYHKFRYGNVEIFALDLRAQKSSSLDAIVLNETTNLWEFNPPAGHSIIGRDAAVGEGESQLSWFLNSLKNSTAEWKFIMSSVPFNIGQARALEMGILLQNVEVDLEGAPEGTTAIAAAMELTDGWSGFPEDSEEILNFIDENQIKNIIVLSGDSHNAAIDDGTNAGLPEMMAGNLDITNSKTITLFESFGLQIWNKGGHGISTNEFNDAFGKVTVFGSDSVRLSLIDEFGTLFAEHTVLSETVTSVADKNLNDEYYLDQNYPNPFNPSTTIRYTLPQKSEVMIEIVDILGNTIETLISQTQLKGTHEIQFDADNLSSGIYFYRLHAGSFIGTKKMILLR